MKGKAVIAFLAAPLLVLPLMMAGGSSDQASASTDVAGATGTGSGTLTAAPAQYASYIIKAGSICKEVTPSIIAAQLQQESGFDPAATNPSGASGIAQFMPSTWASVGKDGDGDGKADIFNAADAIATQGQYMCDDVAAVKSYLKAGKVSGDPLDLALSAYNGGLGLVLQAGGVASATSSYVSSIKANAANFTFTPASSTSGGTAGSADTSAQQSAASLVNAPAYTSGKSLPAETMSIKDPTPGAEAGGMVTARMYTLITTVMKTYPAIDTAALYCWDPHTFTPQSDHPQGKACDIPFYGCTFGDASRTTSPTTGTEAGNAAANWLATNAAKYGIHYIIWRGQIWYATTGTWQTYTGAAGSDPSTCSGGHYDHIHVSVY